MEIPGGGFADWRGFPLPPDFLSHVLAFVAVATDFRALIMYAREVTLTVTATVTTLHYFRDKFRVELFTSVT